jgi:hypothetical protein
MNENKTDRREFNRFSVEFVVEVAAEDAAGNRFEDKAALKDVSAAGAKFTTQQDDRYFPGQELGVNIYLPGTDDVKARMRAKATVVRIDQSGSSDIGKKTPGADISVNLTTRLNFERDDMKNRRAGL